ncbi:MAG: alpha-N-acetylglucosaminidase [Acutalibacteraceae bacterium]
MINLIKRNTPVIADCFTLEVTDKIEGKSYYKITSLNGKIHLSGDCKISLACGYYRYLKDFCHVNLAHCGNRDINLTNAPLPEKDIFHIIPQEKRACFNYCTFSYSMRSWQWEEWEKEIDFMAMNGINMPLTVVGYEAVIFYTLLDYGFSENEALSFVAGPSYFPWQMMTNLDTFLHIPDKKYIDKRLELGRKILARELELGMTPIQQGFAGHVPEKIKEVFTDSFLQYLPMWCGFPGTSQFEPTDKAFVAFGTALLKKQKELFGAYHYYACDPFHENEPPTDGEVYLGEVGRTISKMYTDFDKDAVWVMQAWSIREGIVKAVSKDRLLILDLDGSKAEKTGGFWGYNYICGTLHNFGDRNSLHGSIELLAENPYKKVKAKYPTCVGTGLFMEGFFQNPLYYDLAMEMLTQGDEIDLESWLKNYAHRRWGSDEKCLENAVRLLWEACYNKNCIGRETSSIICARPSTTHYHTAPNDVVALRYDNDKLRLCICELLKSERANTDGYLFDLCDILRQYISNTAKDCYFEIMNCFNVKDTDGFKKAVISFKRMLLTADRLLQTRPELTIAKHIDEALKNACCDEHKELFRRNEITLLTIWGPYQNIELFDYAWREWGGLIKDYYLPRWEMFFSQLEADFDTDGSHISDTDFNHNERNDYDTTDFQRQLKTFEFGFIDNYQPENTSDEKTLDVVKEIMSRESWL